MRIMKKFLVFAISFLTTIMCFTSCEDDSSYANLLSKEKTLISNYVKRNNLQVTETLPADTAWGDNLYYKNSDGLYIHIIKSADRDSGIVNKDTVKINHLVIYRYQKWTIDEDSSLVASSFESSTPNEWAYGVTSDSNYFIALYEALTMMRYNGTAAIVIVPSKLGTSDDVDDVIPYRYVFKPIKLAD